MKVTIKSIKNTDKGSKELPAQFNEEIREDLIKKAVLVLQSNARQSHGADPEAGKKSSAELSRRRRNYRGAYGFGISRVPRKILTRRGTRFNWVGAFAPGTVGGRRAHPPKAEKHTELKINKKENRKAIRSAMSATMNQDIVSARGHRIPKDYPFIIENSIEDVQKTKDAIKILHDIGLGEELNRVSTRTVRAGKGKTRGRRYKQKKGPLLVVSKDCKLMKSAQGILGVDVVSIKSLNADILAPGCKPGRLTLFTEDAIDAIEKEMLFV